MNSIKTLTYVSVVVMFLASDQNLFSPSLSSIANEFNFTHAERDLYLGGYLTLAQYFCGVLGGLVIGLLLDFRYLDSLRVWVIGGVVVVSQVSTILVSTCSTYSFLLLARAVSGFALGGVMPLSISIIGDLFTVAVRGKALTFYSVAVGLGTLMGQVVAGLVAPKMGWRAPFLSLGVAGLVVAFLFVLVTTDPPSSESKLEKITLSKLNSPALWMVLLASFFNAWPWTVINVYAQDFLVHDKGINPGDAVGVVVSFAVCSTLGSITGGVLGDRLWKEKETFPFWAAAVSAMLSTMPLYALLNLVSELGAFYLNAGTCGFLVMVGQIIRQMLVLNMSLPETRGVVSASNAIFDEAGKGMGGLAVGAMSASYGRMVAFNFSLFGWVFVAFLCAGAAKNR